MYKQLKEVGVWAGGCCDCDNYRLSQKQSISTGITKYVQNGMLIIMVVVWLWNKSIHFWWRYEWQLFL